VPVLHRSAKRRCVVTEPALRCGAGLQAVCSSLRCACRSPRAVSPSSLRRSSSRHPPALRVRAACAASPRGPPLLRCASRCSVAFRVASALRRATRPASRRSCCSRCITTACACVRCGARGSMRVRRVTRAHPLRISAGPPPAAGGAPLRGSAVRADGTLAAPACTCGCGGCCVRASTDVRRVFASQALLHGLATPQAAQGPAASAPASNWRVEGGRTEKTMTRYTIEWNIRCSYTK